MKRNILKACVVGLGLLSIVSCDDPMDELTSLVYDRVFSPVDLEARDPQETSVRLQWTPSQGARDYTIQLFEDDSLSFSGEPDVTLTTGETSVLITGLVYDTQYSARVMANDSVDADRNSKWSEIAFRTEPEQNLDGLENENIADRSVTMSWPAEIEMDSIAVCLYTSGTDGATVTSRYLTADEIAAGRATVEGLQPETGYRVRVYLNGKERGTRTFTTIADLEGAILVHDTDDLGAMLEAAQDGDVFALYGGTHRIAGDTEADAGTATISASITIKGIYPTDIPVINGNFDIENGASLSASQIIFDGSHMDASDNPQAFNYRTAGVEYDSLDIQDCTIKNYGKGVMYLNVASIINRVTFNNCIVDSVECNGGDLFDSRTGLIREFNLTNSTICHSATGRDFIRMDNASSSFSGEAGPVITVDHCTIDGVANSSSRRLLYVRYTGNTITWTNNLVSNMPECGRGFSDNSATYVPDFRNNNYWNTLNLTEAASATSTARFFDTSGYTYDPQYRNPDEGDFTIQNEDVSTRQIGDPRWYTAQE